VSFGQHVSLYHGEGYSTMSFGQHVSLYHGEGYSTMSCHLLQKCTMLKVQYRVIRSAYLTIPCWSCIIDGQWSCCTVPFSQHTQLQSCIA